jgi:hypothetical protein
VSENAVITADKGLAGKIDNADVLLIREGYIALDGYNYGFIGGASFNFGGKLFFFGDISKHADYRQIIAFCERHDTAVISLSDDLLYDYGSIIIF